MCGHREKSLRGRRSTVAEEVSRLDKMKHDLTKELHEVNVRLTAQVKEVERLEKAKDLLVVKLAEVSQSAKALKDASDEEVRRLGDRRKMLEAKLDHVNAGLSELKKGS